MSEEELENVQRWTAKRSDIRRITLVNRRPAGPAASRSRTLARNRGSSPRRMTVQHFVVLNPNPRAARLSPHPRYARLSQTMPEHLHSHELYQSGWPG